MLDAGFYAAADAFSYWPQPVADPRILYAYHMYEPWAATSAPNMKREIPYRYPGDAPFGERTERVGSSPDQVLSTATPRVGKESSVSRSTGWWPLNSAACVAGRIVRVISKTCSPSSKATASTGRSSPFAEIGMGSTTSSAPESCHGSTGKRRRRASHTFCRADRTKYSSPSCADSLQKSRADTNRMLSKPFGDWSGTGHTCIFCSAIEARGIEHELQVRLVAKGTEEQFVKHRGVDARDSRIDARDLPE